MIALPALCRTTQEVAQCMSLRVEVFCVEQGFPLEVEQDQFDCPFPRPDVLHIQAVAASGLTIGTVRAIYVDDYAKLGRLAISRQARGTGLGMELCKFAETQIKTRWNVTKLKISSQHQVRRFYEKCGYTFNEKAGYYDEEGWLHCLLEKSV